MEIWAFLLPSLGIGGPRTGTDGATGQNNKRGGRLIHGLLCPNVRTPAVAGEWACVPSAADLDVRTAWRMMGALSSGTGLRSECQPSQRRANRPHPTCHSARQKELFLVTSGIKSTFQRTMGGRKSNSMSKSAKGQNSGRRNQIGEKVDRPFQQVRRCACRENLLSLVHSVIQARDSSTTHRLSDSFVVSFLWISSTPPRHPTRPGKA